MESPPGAVVRVVLSENLIVLTVVTPFIVALLVTERLTRFAPISNEFVPFEENSLPSVKLTASSPVSKNAVFATLVVLGVRPETDVRLI